jgi:hypothetical protein
VIASAALSATTQLADPFHDGFTLEPEESEVVDALRKTRFDADVSPSDPTADQFRSENHLRPKFPTINLDSVTSSRQSVHLARRALPSVRHEVTYFVTGPLICRLELRL